MHERVRLHAVRQHLDEIAAEAAVRAAEVTATEKRATEAKHKATILNNRVASLRNTLAETLSRPEATHESERLVMELAPIESEAEAQSNVAAALAEQVADARAAYGTAELNRRRFRDLAEGLEEDEAEVARRQAILGKTRKENEIIAAERLVAQRRREAQKRTAKAARDAKTTKFLAEETVRTRAKTDVFLKETFAVEAAKARAVSEAEAANHTRRINAALSLKQNRDRQADDDNRRAIASTKRAAQRQSACTFFICSGFIRLQPF